MFVDKEAMSIVLASIVSLQYKIPRPWFLPHQLGGRVCICSSSRGISAFDGVYFTCTIQRYHVTDLFKLLHFFYIIEQFRKITKYSAGYTFHAAQYNRSRWYSKVLYCHNITDKLWSTCFDINQTIINVIKADNLIKQHFQEEHNDMD